MTDLDSAGYIREIMEYNTQGLMLTPKNDKFDTFFQCAMEHALRALEQKAGVAGRVSYIRHPNGAYTAVVAAKES